MKKILYFFSLLILLSINIFGQDCNIYKLEKPYPDNRAYTAFWDSEIIIVIGNNAPDIKYYNYVINRAKTEAKSYEVKKEKELISTDLSKHLILYGDISWYSDYQLFDLPFNKIESGFKINEYEFTSDYGTFCNMAN